MPLANLRDIPFGTRIFRLTGVHSYSLTKGKVAYSRLYRSICLS